MRFGFGRTQHAVVVEAVAVMRERLTRPAMAHHREHLVEDRRSLGALDPERLLLDRVDRAEAERGRSRPPDMAPSVASSLASTTGLRPGSTITDMPNFSRSVRPGAVGHGDERVGRGTADLLGEPERVEAQRLETVDDGAELGPVGGGRRAEAVADPDLQGTIRQAALRWGAHSASLDRATARRREGQSGRGAGATRGAAIVGIVADSRRARPDWIQLAVKARTITGRTTAACGTSPTALTTRAITTEINETTTASLMAAFQVFRSISTSLFIAVPMPEIPRR